MKKFSKLFSIMLALMLVLGMSTSALAASPIEVADDSYQEVLDSINYEHGHDGFHIHEDGQVVTRAACDHVGTLKGTTYVGTCGSCRGPLYYVYCTVCGKYTGARICLCW